MYVIFVYQCLKYLYVKEYDVLYDLINEFIYIILQFIGSTPYRGFINKELVGK